MLNSTLNKIERDYDTTQQCVEDMSAIFRLDDDIHKHTKALGEACRKTLYPMMEKYKICNAQSLDSVCTQILAYSGYDDDVKKVLNTVKANQRNTEKETQLNVAKLLTETWSLALNHKEVNAKQLVIDNLKHNYLAKGGCLAGISARLIQPFGYFILNSLDSMRAAPYVSESIENDDIQIQLAIAASLEPSAQFTDLGGYPEIRIGEDSEEDNLVQLAIALSLEKSARRPEMLTNYKENPARRAPDDADRRGNRATLK